MSERLSVEAYISGSHRQLIYAAGRVATASGLASFLLAITAVITARTLGPTGRGAIVLVSTSATYLMLVLSLGIPISVRVMLGRPDRWTVMRHYLGLGTLLVAGQVVLTAFAVHVVLPRSGVDVTFTDDFIVGLYGGALLGSFLLVHGLFGLGLNDHAALVQTAGASMQVTLVAALAYIGVGFVWPYITALLAGILGQIGLSFVLLARAGFLVRPSFAIKPAGEMIRKGVPAIGLTLGQAATLRIDRILIGLFLTASQVGIYSVAATGTEAVWLLPTALSQVLFHKIATQSIDRSIAARARIVTLAIALAMAVAIFMIAPYVVDALLGVKFTDAVLPLRILLVAAVFLSSYQLDAYALAAGGSVTSAATATQLGLATVLILDFLLIRRYGIVGAAWASVVAYGMMAAMARILVMRRPYRDPTASIPQP